MQWINLPNNIAKKYKFQWQVLVKGVWVHMPIAIVELAKDHEIRLAIVC